MFFFKVETGFGETEFKLYKKTENTLEFLTKWDLTDDSDRSLTESDIMSIADKMNEVEEKI